MVDEPIVPEPSRKASKAEAIVIGLVILVILVGGTYWMNSIQRRPPGALVKQVLSQYVGSESCRECHPGETAQHARSGHSHTLRDPSKIPFAEWIEGKSATDSENPSSSWAYHFQDGTLKAKGGPKEAEPVELLLQYALGSGGHAVTFVTLKDGKTAKSGAIEHRMTIFAEHGATKLGLTPGQNAESSVAQGVKTARGRELSTEETLKCLDCHATLLSPRGNTYLEASMMIPNVMCERCHGPAKSHVEAARRGVFPLPMPFGEFKREPAEAEIRMCGHCHRLPEMAPPGSVRPDNVELARFQPVSLMQSACYKESKDVMRCSTCHDPHTRSSTDTGMYESKCLTCHGSGAKSVCSVSPKNGCIACHMPKRDAGQGILFTDHWIRPQAEKPKQP